MLALNTSQPSCLTQGVQNLVYRLQELSKCEKGTLVTAIAVAGIGLLLIALLNHYLVIQKFSVITQWSLLATGVFIEVALLLSLVVYAGTKKYQRLSPLSQNSTYQFLADRPKWHASKEVKGSNYALREGTRYQEWFQFLRQRENIHEEGLLDLPRVKMVNRPDLYVFWKGNEQHIHIGNPHIDPLLQEYAKTEETLLVLKEDDQFIYTAKAVPSPILRVKFEKEPKLKHYPYLKDENTLLVANFDEPSPRIAAFNLEKREAQRFFPLAPNETLSLIRCCDDILVVGYQSGFLQIIDYDSGKTISTYQAQNEIRDAWIDKSERRLVIYSDQGYGRWGDGVRRRKQEIWKF